MTKKIKMYSVNQIALAMEQYCPRSSRAKNTALTYEAIAHLYLAQSCQLLLGGLIDREDELSNPQVSLHRLRSIISWQYTLHDKRFSWIDWLRMHFPLFDVHRKGFHNGEYNSTLSEVIALFGWRDLQQTISQLGFVPEPESSETIELVPVDRANLTRFHNHHCELITRDDTSPLGLSRRKYWYESGRLLANTQDTDSGSVFPQFPVQHIEGSRTYYSGFNMQNISSYTRKAALAQGEEIDIRVGQYRHKVEFVKSHTTADLEQLREMFPFLFLLVEHTAQFRTELLDCFTSPASEKLKQTSPDAIAKRVKTALQALGFGGLIERSVKKEIKNSEDFDNFKNHKLIKGLIHDLESFTLVLENVYDLDTARQMTEEPLQTKPHIVYRKLSVLLYHKWETEVMHSLSNAVLKTNNQFRIALKVHDCVYLCNPLSGVLYHDLEMAVKEDLNLLPYPLFKFEQLDSYSSRLSQSIEQTHRERINKEERSARLYLSNQVEVSSEDPREGVYRRRISEATLRPTPTEREALTSSDYYGDSYFKDTYGAVYD